MKKLLLLLLILVLLTGGCGSGAGQTSSATGESASQISPGETSPSSSEPGRSALKISPIAQAYLKDLDLGESQILSCDWLKMDAIKPEIKPVGLMDLLEKVPHFMTEYYNITDVDAGATAEENHLVELEIRGLDGENQAETGTVWLISAEGNIYKKIRLSLQKQLLGHAVGDKGEWIVNEQDALFLARLEGKKYSYTVRRIAACQVKNSKTEDMLQSNYLFSPRDVFGNIVSVQGPECDQLKKQSAVLAYLDEALSCCEFQITAGDRQKMEKVLLDEMQREADNLGMDLAAFWESFHTRFLTEMDPDIHKAAALQAERRIKEILLVGAWAEHKGLSIQEQDYIQMYQMDKYELGEKDRNMLAFSCLEDSLLVMTDPLLKNYRVGGFNLQDSVLKEYVPSQESISWQTLSRELQDLGDSVNREISRINMRVLRDEGDEKEQTLMTHFPALHYDYENNLLLVELVADDARGEEEAVRLFQELISDHEGISFRFIKSDEFTEGVDY